MDGSSDSHASSTPTPRQVADAMFSRDHAARAAGMVVEQVALGSATVTMTVRRDMVNGHDICHGGYMALLCDTAFAYACNACNQNTVASGFSIEILAPARLGDTLVAIAVEQAQRGRSGVYDIKLTNQAGDIIALFRGKSARIAGEVVPTAAHT
ncbi:MAG: hydroxyphenylacetyl-CoA thioesterase PaaI [Burkholderiales bacterium]|nr:hydroxyphenylacetyl-CoA thioesterase PaaI [Burkholderiales bacterium]